MNADARFEITLEVVNKIGAYLGTRPYQEVAQLIALLGSVNPIVAAPVAEVPKAE